VKVLSRKTQTAWFGFLFSLLTAVWSQAAVISETQHICSGVDYIHKRVEDVPWSIHIARVERKCTRFNLETTLPQGKFLGLSPTTEQIKYLPKNLGQPIAAINGDFFSWRPGPYQGDTSGLQIMRGEIVSGPFAGPPNRKDPRIGGFCFWLDNDGTPHMGKVQPRFEVTWPDHSKTPFNVNRSCGVSESILYTHIIGMSTRTTNGLEIVLEPVHNRDLILRANEKIQMRVREIRGTNSPINEKVFVLALGEKLRAKADGIKPGDILNFSTATLPVIQNVHTSVGGGPLLVRNGVAAKFKIAERHPRAAFGFNDKYFFFVAVDGRRPGISNGMTYEELAREMKKIGCTEAINLDGGGSATLWVNGQIKNIPSDNRERPCGNALVALRKPTPILASPRFTSNRFW
jgi:hypothetical protein